MIYCSSWYRIRSVVQYFVSSVVGNLIIVNFYIEYIEKKYIVDIKNYGFLQNHLIFGQGV